MEENKTVEVLGTTYSVAYMTINEDKELNNCDGCCAKTSQGAAQPNA